MAEDMKELSIDELDGIAGGENKNSEYWRVTVYRTISAGGTLESVLAQCESDLERSWVKKWWKDMWSPCPSTYYVKAHKSQYLLHG